MDNPEELPVPVSQKRTGEAPPPLFWGADGTLAPVTVDRFTGRAIEVGFLPDGRVIERRTLPEEAVEWLKTANAHDRGEQPKGFLLKADPGNHSKRVKLASIPGVIAGELRRTFGDPRKNPGPWMRWLRDPDNRAFLTSGYVP